MHYLASPLYICRYIFTSMIFVTGSTGLVGAHLLVQLSNSGKTVKALRRNSSDLQFVKRVFSRHASDAENQFNRIVWVEGDLLDVGNLSTLLDDVTEIYHCAAVVSFHPSLHQSMLHTNINGTANLVNAALQKGGIRFCHVSSIAALGRSENNQAVTENALWKNSKDNSAYAISKYGAEREVWRGIAEGLNAVIVNPSVILGPGNWKSGSSELFHLVWKGLKFYTSGITGFVDVRDVVASMIALMQGAHFGERYIVSAENISYKDLFSWIANDLHKRPPTIHVKPWMSEIAWRLMAIKSIFSTKKPAITRETARSSVRKKHYSSEKLIATTGFVFIPIRKSISEICTQFLAEMQPKS